MNNIQKLILVLGAALTIYFMAFAPFTKQVTVDNPYYDPDKKEHSGGHFYNPNQRYIYDRRDDYGKKITYAGATAISTAVLFFVVKAKG